MKDISYLALVLVIIIGVAGGNLLSNWISAEVAAYKIQQAMAQLDSELSKASAQNAANQRTRATAQARALEEQRQQTRSIRAASKIGSDLNRRCNEWRLANEQNATVTTQVEAEKHCDRYEKYLNTGAWAPEK